MNEPEKKLSTKSKKIVGVVAICLVVVLAIVVAIPNFVQVRGRERLGCINYLLEIDAAAQEFALEKGKTNGEAINYPDDLTPYIKLDKNGKMPSCPQGGVYTIKKVGDKPTCSLGTTVTPAHVVP